MQVDLVIAIILAAALALIVGMVSRFLTISGLEKKMQKVKSEMQRQKQEKSSMML